MTRPLACARSPFDAPETRPVSVATLRAAYEYLSLFRVFAHAYNWKSPPKIDALIEQLAQDIQS